MNHVFKLLPHTPVADGTSFSRALRWELLPSVLASEHKHFVSTHYTTFLAHSQPSLHRQDLYIVVHANLQKGYLRVQFPSLLKESHAQY